MEKGPSKRGASRFRTSGNCLKIRYWASQGIGELPNALAEGRLVQTTLKECTKVVLAGIRDLLEASTFADNTFHVLLPMVQRNKLQY